MNRKKHDLRDSERVGQWDSGTVRQWVTRLSAIGYQLSAYHSWLGSIPESKRVQAPAAPGFKASPGLRPWRPPVLPTERAGSEEVFVFRRLRRHHLYSLPRSGNPQPSAHRAVKLKNPRAIGPSILRTFLPEPSEPAEPGRFAAFFISPLVGY